MKFPYGISDFYQIAAEDYFYIDRSDRIPLIEDAGKQLLFLRPRRFGKSLLLSMLENYYDVAKAEQFERLFGRLAIGRQPTPLHNRFLVMRWDFSAVAISGDPDATQQALYDHLNRQMSNFARTYQRRLDGEIDLHPTNAIASFEALLGMVQASGYPLYLLIDEYDNFANEVVMGSRFDRKEQYEALLYGEGALKTVFKAIKSASSGRGLERVFITGVSPVVMSDLTSGYNVAENIYFQPAFHDLCGFTEGEVALTLQQVAQSCHFPETRVAEALAMMRTFYNGYCFSPDLECTSAGQVYNPTLVLYFLKHFQRDCSYPREMLDSNLAMDRGKIAYISQLPGGEQIILDALNGEPPLATPRLADRFGVEEMLVAVKDVTFMASLLYFFGVLTLTGKTALGNLALGIPNLVVRRLYAERLREALLPSVREREDAQRAAEALYGAGAMQPLCDFLERRYFRAFDNRDYRWANELTVKTAFLTLLFNDTLYLVDSETELERSYADLTLIVRPEMRKYQLLDILIEFKYVGLDEAGLTKEQAQALSPAEVRRLAPVAAKLAEAGAKARRYGAALAAKYGEVLRLHSYAVAALGFERVVAEEVV